MRDLYELEVSVNDDIGDDHAEITIASKTWAAVENAREFGDPTSQEVLDAARYLAGLLARLGVYALPSMWGQRRAHGCERKADAHHDTCGISAPNELMEPDLDLGSSPELWLRVPIDSVDPWLRDIRHWLAVLARSEEAQWDA